MMGPKHAIGAAKLKIAGLAAALLVCAPGETLAQTPTEKEFFGQYCAACHNDRVRTGNFSLDQVDFSKFGSQPELGEKILRKLHTGTMPPPDMPQPSDADRRAIVTRLEASLDAASAANLNPGRTETVRRLNRTEYRNAVRDLLALEVDVNSLLPADESGHGFDNVNVGDMSSTLLSRYITAAQTISNLAVGSTQSSLQSDTIYLAADLTQEEHLAGLPIGTRGGFTRSHLFSQDGEYDIQVFLARNLEGLAGGLRDSRVHEMLVLIDREPVKSFFLKKPEDGGDVFDKDLKVRIPVTAGPHDISVTFVKEGSSLVEAPRQPTDSRFNERRNYRMVPAINQVSIVGPYNATGVSDTPSRRRLFVCRPASEDKAVEEACAGTILSTLMKRAYRRPVTLEEVGIPMGFFRNARAKGTFDSGIAMAVSSVLVNPQFLFRVERDAKTVGPSGAYKVSDLELASRLSFFLWSSIPDDELLEIAIQGKLSQPGELEKQTRRMLADKRSYNLASNFAGQWLRLRNIDAVRPTASIYPDFDDNVRQAFRQETELFFDSVLREDRSVRTFLKSDYTFLNERLAKHYGINTVYGSRFRRVTLPPDSRRGGLLRQGSVLSVTSYANRTSPILRGVLVLNNMLGAPPPAPPPNVPALDEGGAAANLPMRQRLAAHRTNAVCASCHRTIDPVGFSLENYNAIGQWRELEVEGQAVDATGAVPGDSEFQGVGGLEEALLRRPELFVGALSENLLTFALGRGVEYYDAPAIRKIVQDAEKDDYKFSSLLLGIVRSVPFQMRRAETTQVNAAAQAVETASTR